MPKIDYRRYAERRLRMRHPEELTELYVKERGPLGRRENETPKEYNNRLANAYSRATTTLRKQYPEEYRKLFIEVVRDKRLELR
jgi:hypothetical protein